MAIERIEQDDIFEKFEGYYIRQTNIDSHAFGVIEVGTQPKEIANREEHYYQIFYKDAYGKSEFHSSYETLHEANDALKALQD